MKIPGGAMGQAVLATLVVLTILNNVSAAAPVKKVVMGEGDGWF